MKVEDIFHNKNQKQIHTHPQIFHAISLDLGTTKACL